MKVGDIVEWESSAGGSRKKKKGEIVAVVKPKERFVSAIRSLNPYSYRSAYGGGCSRDHESYLVLVAQGGNALPILYWPRVKNLRII